MRNLILLLITLHGTLVYGQRSGFKPVVDVGTFKNEFSIQSKKITTIKSDFVQEKVLTLLTERIISKGEFWFKRSDKIRIEYKTPYTYLMIINGDQMISKDGDKENRMTVSSNKMMRQLNRIIVDCVQGTILYNKNFAIQVFESDSMFWLELTPQSSIMKDFFEKIHITLEKYDYSVSVIELDELGGDKTIMRFSNKRFNSAMNDEVFTLH